MTLAVQSASDGRSNLAAQLRAASVPLLVAALSWFLWGVSDRFLYDGPIDKATFGWAVVIPIWAAAPFVAGLRWRDLAAGVRLRASVLAALVVGGLIATLLSSSTASIACEYGPTRSPLGLIPPSLVVGGIVGGLFATACAGASWAIAASHPWRAALISGVLQVGVIPVAGTAFFLLFFGLCNRG